MKKINGDMPLDDEKISQGSSQNNSRCWRFKRVK